MDAAVQKQRVTLALKLMFVADALAMPVHWYYNPADIERDFPGGIGTFEDAPAVHPGSIMSLHSTRKGGRGAQQTSHSRREIVGEVILKGRRHLWGQSGRHYHHGMRAGENTLNSHCVRVLMRSLAGCGGLYNRERFLEDYIAFMTADPPQHPDTYAESYHRGFFANLEAGREPHRCAAKTHDTASVGGLVPIAAIFFSERLRGVALEQVHRHCLDHLALTHPDAELERICRFYVELLEALLFRPENGDVAELLMATAQKSVGLDLAALVTHKRDDRMVVGRLFSPACYISDSWPSLLYLAYKYRAKTKEALLTNTNLGGDNVHRGIVMAAILGLGTNAELNELFEQLVDRAAIAAEIDGLIDG